MRPETYDEATDRLMAEMRPRVDELIRELEVAIIRAPALRPVLGPFVRMLGGNVPRTRLGMFLERVRIEYALLRLERRLARARAVKQ